MLSTRLIRPLLWLLCLTLVAPTLARTSEDEFFNRYYVRVKKNNINVRARANTSSEVMDRAAKGADLLVIGESGSWVKIRPQADKAFAWVHKELVMDGVIGKNNVNIRVGPSVSHSILGKLQEGDPIMIVQTQEEWIQIEMPRQFGFWIAKSLTRFLCPENEYHEYLLKEKQAKTDYAAAENLRQNELKKRYFEVNHDLVIKAYQGLIDNYPGTNESKKAMERILDLQEKKAMARQKKMTFQERRRVVALFDEAEALRAELLAEDGYTPAKYDKAVENYRKIINEFPGDKMAVQSVGRLDEIEKIKEEKMAVYEKQKAYRAVGKVKVFKHPTLPSATHKLVVPGPFASKPQCALFSNNIDLRAYEKKAVILEGHRIIDPTADTPYPLIEVVTIQLKD